MESESGISFTEFSYQLLQGYDFVHLARTHGVRMQVRVCVCVRLGGVGQDWRWLGLTRSVLRF
jgi:tyrosyl-tRNA synthetase